MPDFRVQHGTIDVPAAGTTQSITAVSNLSNAFVLNNNSRGIGGGLAGSSASARANDAGLLVELTATDTVTFTRDGSAAGANRASWSVWEYTGNPGGLNEFIVRDRRTLTLNSGTGISVSYTPSGIISAGKVIPFITGISSNEQSQDSHDHGTATAEINQTTGEVTVYSRGNAGVTQVQVSTVEFTGSNWAVHYGTQQQTANAFTMTLGSSVSSWNNTLLYTQFFKSGTSASHDSLASVNWTAEPAITDNQVVFGHHSNHTGSTGQRYAAYALENSGMTVSRFSNTSQTAGNTDINVSSAGLTTLDEALIFGTSTSSGSGTAHLRGTRNFQLTSTTNAQHFCHRSGNEMTIRMQVVELPAGLPEVTGSLGAQEAGSDTFSASGVVSLLGVSGTLAAQETGIDSFAASGASGLTGTLSAQEAGADSFIASGSLALTGAMVAIEAGEDVFVGVGGVDNGVTGTMAAQEYGGAWSIGDDPISGMALGEVRIL